MKIDSLEQAERELRPYISIARRQRGRALNLDRVTQLMEVIGHPERDLRIIHIAGTSGKTSTAYYLSALLASAGQSVGLTISPNLSSITERVQLNNWPLSEKDFCRYLETFLGKVKAARLEPSYYELLYSFAMWVFARERVDYAVLEAGLGGLNDATNIARRADKLCLLTDIGYDHRQILGPTLADIAAHKVGIVQPDNQLIMYPKPDQIMKVVNARIHAQGAALQLINQTDVRTIRGLKTLGLADFKVRNWFLALKAYQYLKQRDGLRDLSSPDLNQALHINIPGRMETINLGDKTLILDGAHNAQKATALVSAIRQLCPGHKPTILLGIRNGKDYRAMVRALADITEEAIITSSNQSAVLPTAKLAQEFNQYGIISKIVSDLGEAYKELLNSSNQLVLVTGSLYLVGAVRELYHAELGRTDAAVSLNKAYV